MSSGSSNREYKTKYCNMLAHGSYKQRSGGGDTSPAAQQCPVVAVFSLLLMNIVYTRWPDFLRQYNIPMFFSFFV